MRVDISPARRAVTVDLNSEWSSQRNDESEKYDIQKKNEVAYKQAQEPNVPYDFSPLFQY